jgi:hypothetical protein
VQHGGNFRRRFRGRCGHNLRCNRDQRGEETRYNPSKDFIILSEPESSLASELEYG